MIWLVAGLLIALAIGGVAVPFLGGSRAGAPQDAELAQCRAGLARIDAEKTAGRLSEADAGEARRAIERRVLALTKASPAGHSAGGLRQFAPLAMVFAVLVAGLYYWLGAPTYNRDAVYLPGATLPDGQIADVDTLASQIAARLARDPDAPMEIYVFLARAQWGAGKHAASLATYDAALARFPDVPQLAGEAARMRSAMSSGSAAPQISTGQRAAIDAMTPEEQAKMIAGMVDGLAARLAEDPRDIEGWLRLIRARTVMGETGAARADLQTARRTFTKDDEAMLALGALAESLGLEP